MMVFLRIDQCWCRDYFQEPATFSLQTSNPSAVVKTQLILVALAAIGVPCRSSIYHQHLHRTSKSN